MAATTFCSRSCTTKYHQGEKNKWKKERLNVGFSSSGRYILEKSKPGQCFGSMDIHKERDAMLIVLLDRNFDAYGSGPIC